MKYNTSRVKIAVALATAIVAMGASSANAKPSDPNKCRVEISKQGAKYEATVLKALSKCEISAIKGNVAATECTVTGGDAKTEATVTKAATKMAAAIAKKCCGDDKTCGSGSGDGADLDHTAHGWAECSNFTGTAQFTTCQGGDDDGNSCDSDGDCGGGGTCGADPNTPVLAVPADPSEIGPCIEARINNSVVGTLAFTLDSLTDSSLDKDLNKCQQEIAKQVTKVVGGVNKEVGKCNKTRPSQGGVCPTTKGLAKIEKSLGKLSAGLAKKCSGFSAAEIGLPGACPAVSVENGLDIADCAATINTLGDFENCIACLALKGPQNEFVDSCGNGSVDFEIGETCDDGNDADGDECPSDCRISECRIDTKGKTQQIQVDFAVPAGSDVMGLEAVVHYPERAVILEGFGDVSDSVTNTPGDASVTVVDTNASLNIVALDADAQDALAAGTLFRTTFDKCTSLGKNQANLAAAWEGAKVKGAKSDSFVCQVIDAFDTSFAPVDGVTCAVSDVK